MVLTGPTATGKTGSAIDFAQRFDGEIVSADSMLVYRGMDIGTAKPTEAQQALVPHHMVDVADPADPYSVSLWQKGAQDAIEGILARGKLPVVVGGTGLYIQALLSPNTYAGAQGDPEIRARLEDYLARHGQRALHSMLALVDAPSAARLHENDTRRVIRALEVYQLTGRTLTEAMREDQEKPPRYRALTMAVDLNREILYDRIGRRVDQMLKEGLVDEVQGLLKAGIPATATSMQGLGYKEIVLALSGQMPLPDAVELLKRRTRNFAKRQLTWFRRDPSIRWLRAQGEPSQEEVTRYFAETYTSDA